MNEVPITKRIFNALQLKLGDDASLFRDDLGRHYLEMRYAHLQASEQRAVNIYTNDEEVHYFYYAMPPRNKDPLTGVAVSHPNGNETGGMGILWRLLRISDTLKSLYPTISQANIHAQFTYSHHDTKKQARAHAGFVAVRIRVLDNIE